VSGQKGKATAGVQLPISGGLSDVLEGQSQGLVTIQTGYADPAHTIASMQPEDEQTAAGYSPNTGTAQDSPRQVQFINNTTKGSPTDKGVDTDPAATQLGRAVMVTEMTGEKDGTKADNCACLVGRPELAFMAQGYNVKVLNASTAEPKTIGTLPETMGSFGDGDTKFTSVPTEPQDLMPMVDTYLRILYEDLDTPHQIHEQQLRGGLAALPPAAGINIPALQEAETTGISPPFSSPNRAALGDVTALAQQGSSATAGITDTWNNAADTMRKNAKRTLLEGQIREDQREIASLLAERADLVTKQASGIRSTGGQDILTRIADIDKMVADLQLDLAKKQLELAQL
jgi:hypothetical protein